MGFFHFCNTNEKKKKSMEKFLVTNHTTLFIRHLVMGNWRQDFVGVYLCMCVCGCVFASIFLCVIVSYVKANKLCLVFKPAISNEWHLDLFIRLTHSQSFSQIKIIAMLIHKWNWFSSWMVFFICKKVKV